MPAGNADLAALRLADPHYQNKIAIMKKISFFLLIPVIAAFVNEKAATIKGTITTPDPVKMIYLSYRNGDNSVNDSTILTNGQFSFKAKVEEPTAAVLSVRFEKADGQTNTRYERKTIFLQPGTITINIKDSLKFATISGSKAHTEYERYTQLQKPYTESMQALNQQYMKYRTEKNEEGMKQIEAMGDSINERKNEEVVRPYLENNTQSPIALYVLKQYGGYDLDPAKVEPLFAKLPKSVQGSRSGVEYKELIETAKKTAVGVYAMDFTQNDTLDRAVSLSSFKGKYVLVDFWASWCGPCRVENPNLVKAFNQYKEKNFTVLGVSLDRPEKKQSWLDAIHKDGLTWTHVSDLKYWDNAVAKQYGIRAIPQNFLIDPQGKIVAKNIRGDELNKKLQEILK